jgi:hypothetical protein
MAIPSKSLADERFWFEAKLLNWLVFGSQIHCPTYFILLNCAEGVGQDVLHAAATVGEGVKKAGHDMVWGDDEMGAWAGNQ